MTAPSCATCKFKVEWNPIHSTLATCIRNPPQLVAGQGESSAMPAVKRGLVCGEYRRRRWWHRTPKQFPPLPSEAAK